MAKIISFFIRFFNTLHKLLFKFVFFLLSFIPNDSNPSTASNPYHRFKVHPIPSIEPEHILISFIRAKEPYEQTHNKPLQPVFRHVGKVYPDKSHTCPHCGNKLSLIKNQDGFDIYICSNKKCNHYLQQRKNLSKEDKRKHKTNPSAFSLHYITRVFNASLDVLEHLQLKITPSLLSACQFVANEKDTNQHTSYLIFSSFVVKLSLPQQYVVRNSISW